ncbi:MAG: hypothetical protein CVU78_01950 [Elusimicrobia bacterium HGW-Elusimicrobia-2]|nr:MAG: hypothetical protein CVU78_01950 [Elusimicrobia bacterium HGW-Elusimicrobia-2]
MDSLIEKINAEMENIFVVYSAFEKEIARIIHNVCHSEGVFTTEKSKIPHFVRNDRPLFLSSEYE